VNNFIQKEGLLPLIEALFENPNLRIINLSDNWMQEHKLLS